MTDRKKPEIETASEKDTAAAPPPARLDKETIKDLDAPAHPSPKGGSLINCQTR